MLARPRSSGQRQEPTGTGAPIDQAARPAAARPPGEPELLAPWRSTFEPWCWNPGHRLQPWQEGHNFRDGYTYKATIIDTFGAAH
jgi:hypothetical protein